jgi:hypothetical protein
MQQQCLYVDVYLLPSTQTAPDIADCWRLLLLLLLLLLLMMMMMMMPPLLLLLLLSCSQPCVSAWLSWSPRQQLHPSWTGQ